MKELDANEFKDASRNYLEPYFDVETKGSPQFFDLPVVLVPPEAIDIENMGSGSEAGASPAKNEEWPEYRISLFDNDVCPKFLLLAISRWLISIVRSQLILHYPSDTPSIR